MLPILKKASEEYYSDPERRGVMDLRTYYNSLTDEAFIKDNKGKLHHPASLYYCPLESFWNWKIMEGIYVNCNGWGIFFEELSESEKDRLLEVLNDKSYEERARILEEEYRKREEGFKGEYEALCEKYGLEWQRDDPYCGLELVDRQ